MNLDPTPTLRPEMAPSATATEVPSVLRVVGSVGLLLAVLGTATLISAEYGRGVLPVGAGYFFAILGVTGMLLHAMRDHELEMRRLYGGLAAGLLVAGVILGFYPGGIDRQTGYFLLPYGLGLGFLSLMFTSAFLRHEDEEPIRNLAQRVTLAVGALLLIGCGAVGLVKPAFLVPQGLLLSLLGLGFVLIYLNSTDTDLGLGYQVAIGLGIVGLVLLAVALGRTVAPTVLFEGPSALKTPFMTTDYWKLFARLASIALSLGLAGLVVVGTLPIWLRTSLAVLGVALAAVFITGTITKAISNPPAPFLIPYGLILGGLGLLYILISVAILSEASFVVMTRREFNAYFYSPIAYVVLIGMAFMGMVSYGFFLAILSQRPSFQEPIVALYPGFSLVGAITVIMLVPILTMRTFSEERRTGTYEVLLTAPVQEWVVVLSKFLACWLFFLVAWLPMFMYLLTLPLVGTSFDYRPILTFYLALACTGAGFIAMGTFFSSTTKNQIIAAVLTGAMMFFYLLTIVASSVPYVGDGIKSAVAGLSFLSLWQSAAQGELTVQTILVHLSLTVFWLFLTVKVLETRKWS